jgi:hypothetical protein
MHEIIHVVVPANPADAVSQNLEIEAVNGQPLAAGYYFVLWPTKKATSRKRGKRYFGPFRTPVEARLLLTSALTLGLAENEQIAQKIAECRSTTVRQAPAANDWRHAAYAAC